MGESTIDDDGNCIYESQEHVVPNLLSVIMSCASDFTLGLYGTSMHTFIDAFYTNMQHIGQLVLFTQNGRGAIFDKGAYYRLVKCIFIHQYRTKLLPKSDKPRKKRKVDDIYDEPDPEPEPEIFCTDYSLSRVRHKLNKRIIAEKYIKYLKNEDLLAEMDKLKFDLFLRNVRKLIPPNKEINNRHMLVAGYIVFVNSYGNAVVRFVNPLDVGFKLIDKSKRLCGNNLDFKASYDWGKWPHKWAMAKMAPKNDVVRRVRQSDASEDNKKEGVAIEADWDDE